MGVGGGGGGARIFKRKLTSECHEKKMNHMLNVKTLGPRGYKTFSSCSIQLSMKFSLLINMKMPTIVGIFIIISREISMISYN